MNAITSNVITAVATAIVLGLGGWAVGVFDAGNKAMSKEAIREVLQEELMTDDGKTYGQAFSALTVGQAEIKTTVGIIQTDVRDLEKSVIDLASD